MHILIAGASSAMAVQVAEYYEAQGHTITKLSTKENTGLQVQNYTENLPDIEGAIDALIYFPGSINLKPFARISLDEFTHDININALGAAMVSQKYLPNLKASDNANIIFFSTVAAKLGMPFHSSIAMAKGAVEGLTISLAAELAPKIRVNAIAPSLTDTPLASKLLSTPEKIEGGAARHPLKRVGTTDDMLRAVDYLVQSTWVTGQILGVDGGMGSVK
jgi:NAD(P)-dependent dehydrogenase (short-subunit alcohol dehydrogenase family)